MLSSLRRMYLSIRNIIFPRDTDSNSDKDVASPPLQYSQIEPVGSCIICFDDVEKSSLAVLDCECQYVAHQSCLRQWQQKNPRNGCIVCRNTSLEHVNTTAEQWEQITGRLKSLGTLSLISLLFYIAIIVHDTYN